MKVVVDMQLCQNYGQCVFAAPDVFELDEEGELQYEAIPDESQREAVMEAIDVCPLQAISMKEES